MSKIKDALLALRNRLHIPTKEQLVHKGEHFFHMTYLGAVTVEAHGMYAHAAGVLLVVMLAGIFVHDAP